MHNFALISLTPPRNFLLLSSLAACLLLCAVRPEDFAFRAANQGDAAKWVEEIRKAMKGCLTKRAWETTYRGMLKNGQMFTKHHHDPVGRFNLKQKDSSRLVKISHDEQRITWHKVRQRVARRASRIPLFVIPAPSTL